MNKQYAEPEYNELLPKIIEQMKKDGEYGEFFPSRISPWAYNDTIAYDFFPLTKDEVLSRGCRWQEADAKEYSKQMFVIPSNIKDIDQSVLKEILACECNECKSHEGKTCGRNYVINPPELAFYFKQKLPLPRKCPDCRYNARQRAKNPMKLRITECYKCRKGIETTYPSGLSLKILCEQCYKKEIY